MHMHLLTTRTDIRRIEREPESGGFSRTSTGGIFLLRAARQHDEVAHIHDGRRPQCQFERARRCAERARSGFSDASGVRADDRRRRSYRATRPRGECARGIVTRRYVPRAPSPSRHEPRGSAVRASRLRSVRVRLLRAPRRDVRVHRTLIRRQTIWRASRRRARRLHLGREPRSRGGRRASPPSPSRVNNLGRALRL